MPYTKEQLLSNSTQSKVLAREGRTSLGVLTTEEQQARLDAGHKSVSVHHNDEVFYFTDDYCMLLNIVSGFTSCSTSVPMAISPREAFPDGWIHTAKDYIKVFEKDRRQINSMDELVAYLNRFE